MEKYLPGDIQNLEKGRKLARMKQLVAFPTADKSQMLVFFIRYKFPSLVVWNYQKLAGFTVSAQQASSLVIYTFYPIYRQVNKSCNAHLPFFTSSVESHIFSFASTLSVTACSSCILSGYYSQLHLLLCIYYSLPSLMCAIWLRIKNNLLSAEVKKTTLFVSSADGFLS